MKRVFEFIPAEQEAIVSRILVTTHQAIDEAFPDAKPAPHRFAKTVFGDEPTVNQMMPLDSQSHHHMSEDALREVSDRLSSPKPYIFSDETPLTVKHRHDSHSDPNAGNTIFGLRQKRRIQTLVGCVVLVVGLILAYLFW